jgi:hypothetical protein
MSGLVNVGEIPYTDVDTSGITAGAGKLRTVASAVRDGTADIHSAWTPISHSYEGPGDQDLYDAMTPIVPQGTAFGDDLDTVAKALDDFVTEVTPIVAKLKTYVTRGNTLHADVKKHDGAWDEDETLNGENNDIINGVANQVVAYQAAERKCANTIRGLSGLAALHAMTGDDPDDKLGYGYKELPMGTELPWGTAEARKESCGEKTLYFVPNLLKGVVVDGIWGTVQGLGMLVGIDGTGWHLDTLTDSWKGMGSLIGYNAADDSWSWGNAGEAWKGLGKATVGWDEWAKDPGTAAGQAIWGVGSLLIPVAGEVGKVGALGKVGEVAGTVGKAGKFLDLVDAGAWASKGLTSVLPKLGDLKGIVSAGLGDSLHGFTGEIADFKTGLGDLHGHHGGDVEVPPARSESGADANANAHAGGSTVEAPPVREPELVGAGGHGGHGESTTTTHGGGSESGATGHGGSGDGGPEHGGSGHGTDAGPSVGGDDTPGGDGHPGADGAGSPDGEGLTDGSPTDGASDHGTTPTESPAYAHVSVDSAGNDISHLVTESGLTPTQLHDYLANSWGGEARAAAFEQTGVWPHDVQIPKDASVLKADGTINWDEVPQGGYTLDDAGQPIKEPLVPQVGDVFDRYGPSDGRYTSPVPETGPYTYDQRSLPYLEDPAQYHQYRVVGDFSDIQRYYDAAPQSVQADVDRIMRRFNSSFEDLGRASQGDIAAGFGAHGGGRQVEMPMTVELLKRLGLIEEI